MLCIKKNKFQSVQTCWNLSKHVSIRSNLSRFQVSPPPPSPSPLLPLFPFLFGGEGGREGEGGGEATTTKTPRKGGGRSPPPPPQDFNNNNKKQNSLTLSSLCCVIYPSYPLEVSLSVHCCCCSKLHKHLWRRCPLNKKQNSLWHTSIFIFIYIYYISPLNKYLIFSFSKKKFLLSVVDARWWSNGVNLNSFFLSQSFFFSLCVILFNEI